MKGVSFYEEVEDKQGGLRYPTGRAYAVFRTDYEVDIGLTFPPASVVEEAKEAAKHIFYRALVNKGESIEEITISQEELDQYMRRISMDRVRSMYPFLYHEMKERKSHENNGD